MTFPLQGTRRDEQARGNPRPRRPLASLLAAVVLLLALAPAALAVTPRTSLTAMEPDFMCTVCREPLAVAQSPEAEAERNFIRGLIAQGLDRAQIDRAMVANYGPAVLAKPPAQGFNLTVYVLPALIVVAGLGLLAVLLPRWRQAARARLATPAAAGPRLSDEDVRRLEAELSRFGG